MIYDLMPFQRSSWILMGKCKWHMIYLGRLLILFGR